MIKRLTRHGNSLALIIDRPILDLVKIEPDMPVEISTDDGRRLIISPVRDPGRQKQVRAALERVNRKHGPTLKKLAE